MIRGEVRSNVAVSTCEGFLPVPLDRRKPQLPLIAPTKTPNIMLPLDMDTPQLPIIVPTNTPIIIK